MFDIGFSEIILISIVGLIVLGPERLPKVVRTVGLWTGRARGYVRQISAELEKEARKAEVQEQFQQAQSILQQGQEKAKSAMADLADVSSETAADAKTPPIEKPRSSDQ